MALKKMRISFDIDIPVLLSMLAAGNSAMKIDVYGDERPAKLPKQLKNGHGGPKLLEGPQPTNGRGRPRGKVTAYATLLAFFATNKDRGVRPVELQPLLVAIGLNAKSVSPQLTKLRTDGYVKKHSDDGLYHVTARGLAHHEKTTATMAQAAE
jgi:hypothetical protein